MPLVLLIICLLVMLCGLPQVGFHHYGYGPSGVGLLLLIIVLVILFAGRG